MKNQAYVLLGSNIDPEKNIPLAIETLSHEHGLKLVRASSTWRTKPVGSEAADFLNLAIEINTDFDLHTLKEEILCDIEDRLGRQRTADKYAPRTIDLDVLVFNDQVLDDDIFIFDHVIMPMAELLPDLYSNLQMKTLGEISSGREQKTMAVKVKTD